MGRRDEVWERKRQQFLARRSGHGGFPAAQNGGHGCRPPPLQNVVSHDVVPPAPGSPLSELVHRGYPEMAIPEPTVSLPPKQPNYIGRPMQQGGGGIVGSGSSRSQSRSRPGSNQEGFDRGVAQQWSSNVKANVESHQQLNDPNFAGFKKPSGYRVSQAPGGGSSISLSWGGQESAGAFEPMPSRQGRNNSRGPSPMGAAAGQRATPMAAGAAQRTPSHGRRASGGVMDGVNYGGPAAPHTGAVAAGGRRSSAPFGTDSSVPLPRAPVREPSPASHLGFGGRVDGSSNAYACGHNQNAGNYISDRRMTRVARPPGGTSSVVFG
mmetsp:Transcript_76978/g.152469  ORF Transcript_76978/g.152469 Transcript_76978/m.152469 type:complete len:323 (-) Transcript_76978:89-1057(-)